VVCAQLQARLRDGHQRRSAPTHVCQRGQSRPKSFAQDGLGSKTQVPCFGGLVLPDNPLGGDGSLNQAERCPVESWVLLMSTTGLNTTLPPVSHGCGTRLLACDIMATACSIGAKAKMWQTGPSVDFLFATSNVDPWKHVHPRDASGCYLCSNHHASGSLVQAETRQSRADETAPWH